MKPNFGKVVSLDNQRLVDVDDSNQSQYVYTGKTVVMGDGVRCATFINDKGDVFAQPWAISGKFRKPGELNAGSRLKNEQVREMVTLHVVGNVPVDVLAKKFDISKEHCQKIVSGQAWRHITVNLISHLRHAGSVGAVSSATNKPRAKNKLSPAIVPFLRKDHTVNKMTVALLAKKYCLSKSQVRKILAGKHWKSA
jgi:uncharacterized protein YggU (UPF0235/DUF167 family)